jgi:hypothetical protein
MMFGYWAQAIGELSKAVDESVYGKKPNYRPEDLRPFPNPPLLLTGASYPPAVSFYTLPQLHIWKDWIKGIAGYRFGPNRVPSGSFDEPDKILKAGWTDVSHQYEGIIKKIIVPRREPTPVAKRKETKKTGSRKSKKNEINYEKEQIAENDHVLKMSVEAADRQKVDELDPNLGQPAAAILSPAVRVAANNLIRISVLVRRPTGDLPGKGGVIVRDTIGGEQFQFRSAGPIAGDSRVVLYRKAPADGVLRVMLGLAGYGDVFFDDFRVQIVEEDIPYRPVDPGLVQGGRPDRTSPHLPDAGTPAAAALPSTTRRER